MSVKIIKIPTGETKVEISKAEWIYMGEEMDWFVGGTNSPYLAEIFIQDEPSHWEFIIDWEQEVVRDVLHLSYLPDYNDVEDIYETLITLGENEAKKWLRDRGLNDRDLEVVIDTMYLSNFSSQKLYNTDIYSGSSSNSSSNNSSSSE